MKSVSLCHAPADRGLALELAAYIERNLPLTVSCEDAVVGADLDILDASERALSAEVALVLLSPASVPKQLDRARWMDVFVEQPKELMTHIGFVLVGNCPFPQLLRRERFFDASADPLTAFRNVKRWLLFPNGHGEPGGVPSTDLDQLRRSVSDRPGTVEVDAAIAARFAGECSQDFESVYRLDCRGLSRDGILAEMASAAGPWSREHRVLFVLAGVDPAWRDVVPVDSLASAIFTPALDWAIQNPASDALRAFHADGTLSAGWKAVKLLTDARRLAEALDLLGRMTPIAEQQGDALALTRIEREQYWLRADLEYDGSDYVAPLDSTAGGQLSFAFPE